MLPNGALMF
ncbi:hypothetical protein LINPERHAP1_LOCUS26617 [Linum perenne]